MTDIATVCATLKDVPPDSGYVVKTAEGWHQVSRFTDTYALVKAPGNLTHQIPYTSISELN